MQKPIEHYLKHERYENDKKIVTIPLDDYKQFDKFEVRCPYLYRIVDEGGITIPFIFNEAQTVFHDAIEEEFARSESETGVKRCQVITLKPRQFGATTYTALRNIDLMLMQDRDYRGIVLMHNDVDIPLVFEKYKTAYENLPDIIEIKDNKGNILLSQPFKPEIESSTGYQMKFLGNRRKDGTTPKSWVTVRTAGAGDNVGKGGTVIFFHATECANYNHYDKVMSSVKQQMSNPDVPKFVVLETTANGTTGAGEGYYKEWIKAEASWKRFLNGETTSFEGVRPVFVKWYLLKKYRKNLIDNKLIDIDDIDFGSPEAKQQFLEREKILLDQYNVPIEAINWYRFNIKENCSYRYVDACRYYPTFAEDAFLATNNSFFDSAKLFAEKATYEIDLTKNTFPKGYLNEDLTFVPSMYGELAIKTEPVQNYLNRYIVSVDQSEGLERGDYTSMKVFDRLTREFVAHWYGKAAEDEVAKEMMKLGYYYNDAYLIPERNRATIINIIKPDGVMPYAGEIFAESYSSNGEATWGWNTNTATRKLLLDELYAFYRDEGYDKLFDFETLDQYINFVRKVTGRGTIRFEASAGKADDIVFADGLCIIANNRIEDEIIQTNQDKTDIERLIESPIQLKRKKAQAHTMLGVKKNVSFKKV